MLMNNTNMEAKKPLFRELNADEDEPEITEVESMCMHCHANGMTRLLLTKIPHYKEIVVMSFSCNECGYCNNEVQPGGQYAEKGVRIRLEVMDEKDLNRQVVRSDQTSVKIVQLDFEIPPKSQKGDVTTIEGIIDRSIAGLEQDQVIRRVDHPEVAKQIQEFIDKLKDLKSLSMPFTLIFEDISGNVFVENPNIPKIDHNCKITQFKRTKEQDHNLGIFTSEEIHENCEDGLLHPIQEDEYPLEELEAGDIMQFKTNCSNCGSPCDTNMKMTNIPHFKEVIIMATVCDTCGHRTNEVKSGSGIESEGIQIEISVREKVDLHRDVLKSESCSLRIPELDFEVGSHALGGRLTTVEGILMAIKEQLGDHSHSYLFGDSIDSSKKTQIEDFFAKLDQVLESKQDITLIFIDPTGNSYVQSLADDGTDENLKISRFQRTFEQNEELGLNDMKLENYEETSS